MFRRLGWGAAVLIVGLAASPALALDIGQCLPITAMNQAMKAEGQRVLIIGNRMDYEGQPLTFAGTTMSRGEWSKLARDVRSDATYRGKLAASLRAKGRTPAQINAFLAKLGEVSAIQAKGDADAPVPHVMSAFTSNDDGSVAYNLEGNMPAGQPSSRACIRGKFAGMRLANGEATDMFTAKGDVMQLDGTSLKDVAVAVRRSGGSASVGNLVALLADGRSPPIIPLAGLTITPVGRERASND